MVNKIEKWFTIAVICLSIASLSSCEKDDVDEYGAAQLKIVNASSNSGIQDFYLLGDLVKDELNYNQYSDFITVPSGNRLTTSFKDHNSGVEYAGGELWMLNGKHYTVYLIGTGSNARVKQFEDDLSSPASGKAKIKFIHISDGAPSDLRIKDALGSIIVNDISRNIESAYKSIDPGTFTFSIYNTGTASLVGNFQLDAFVSGKIYSIFIDGESSSSVQVHKVEY